MRWGAVLLGLVAAFVAPTLPAAGEERAFFDGLEARMIGPYRGGRAMVAVGVRQDPHVYYMGTTGGVWKTVNAGASWEPVQRRRRRHRRRTVGPEYRRSRHGRVANPEHCLVPG